MQQSRIVAKKTKNMINKIIKERRRSMNVAPTRPSNKSQWQGAQEDPKQKPERAVFHCLEESNFGESFGIYFIL
jgi:hypothetical protein